MTTVLDSPFVPPVPGLPDDDGLLPLTRTPIGWRRVVVAVDGPDRHELERDGLVPGSILVVTARTPLGGPVVVELDRSRVSLPSRVATQVTTRPLG